MSSALSHGIVLEINARGWVHTCHKNNFLGLGTFFSPCNLNGFETPDFRVAIPQTIISVTL